jgi:hypothetical protein
VEGSAPRPVRGVFGAICAQKTPLADKPRYARKIRHEADHAASPPSRS